MSTGDCNNVLVFKAMFYSQRHFTVYVWATIGPFRQTSFNCLRQNIRGDLGLSEMLLTSQIKKNMRRALGYQC